MIALSILLTICLLVVSILSFPVKIHFESSLVCYINWLFVKVRIRFREGNLKTDLKLFNRRTRFFSEKQLLEKEQPVSSKKKKSKQKKKSKKVTRHMVMENLGDAAVKKTLRIAIRFLLRCLKSIKISVLKWNIGIKDYYWQGIITGLLHSFPRTKNLQLTGNFQEQNDFKLVVRISILRILSAVVLLLACFPYIKAFRLYKRVFQ